MRLRADMAPPGDASPHSTCMCSTPRFGSSTANERPTPQAGCTCTLQPLRDTVPVTLKLPNVW